MYRNPPQTPERDRSRQRAQHRQLQHLQMTDPDDRRSRSRSHSQTPPETPQRPFQQPNFVAANPAHISSLGLGVPLLRFPTLTSMHQQNSVSDCPVVDLSDDLQRGSAMAIDDPFSDITTGSINSGAIINSGASTVNLQSEDGPSLLGNSMASIPPAVVLPPDWDRPLRNPIPQNITPAPVSLYKGKSREINSPLPAGPSLTTINLTNTVAGTSASMRMNAEAGPSTVRHSDSTSAVNTGTSAFMRMNAEAGPSTVRQSGSTSAVNTGTSASAFAEGLHTTAGPSGLRNLGNPLASIPEVHLPTGWDRPLSNPIPQHIPSVPVPHRRLPQRLYVTGGSTANPSVDGLNRGHIAHRSRETNFRNEAAQWQATYDQRELQQQADERLRQQQQQESRQAVALETALSLASQHQAVFDELGAQEAQRQQQMAEQARMLQNLHNDHISEQQRRELEQEEQQRQLTQLAEQRQHQISEQQRREEQQRQLAQLTEQRQQEEEEQRQQEEEARQVRLEALRLQHLENEERWRIQDKELAAWFLTLFQQREQERLEELEYERENRQRIVAEAELQWQQRVQNLSAEELDRQLEAEQSERDHYLQSQREAQQYQENRTAEREARQAWEAELAAVVEAIQQDLDME